MKGMFPVLSLLSIALLLGCLGFGGPEGELFLVPDKADAYLVMKPSAILADEDVINSMKESGTGDIEAQFQKARDELGFDLQKINKATVFMKLDGTTGSSMPYGGAVLYGEFDSNTIAAKLREQGEITEEQYGGFTIYTRDARDVYKSIDGTDEMYSKQPEMSSVAVINSKTAVFGTPETVRDCIDVKNGQKKALAEAGLERVAGAVDKNGMAFFVMRIPDTLKKEAEESETGIVDTKSFSKMTHLGVSFNKAGSNMALRVAVLFQTAKDAEKSSDVLQGLVIMAKGMTEEDSASGKIVRDIKIGADGDMLRASLDATKETWDKLQQEVGKQDVIPQTPDYSQGWEENDGVNN
ncbi:MAG: hypothetical protein ABIF01_04130 [Candidatus Micrarchaeota archaeon]